MEAGRGAPAPGSVLGGGGGGRAALAVVAIMAEVVGVGLRFQGHEAGDRDGEIELSKDRLEIGQAASKRIDRNDVAITGGRQRGEAEIPHAPDFLRAASLYNEIGKGAGAQLPDKGVGRGKDRRETLIDYDRT